MVILFQFLHLLILMTTAIIFPCIPLSEYVVRAFNELKANSVCGLHGVPVFTVKGVSEARAPVLTSVFN